MIPLSKEPIRVTDHAVLRYLERAMGLNVEIVREHISQVCSTPAAFGAVCVRAEGLRFEIRNNAIVTVAPGGAEPSRLGRVLRRSA
jgi:hypothetical protein